MNSLQGIFPYLQAITPKLKALITQKGLYTGAWGIQSKQDFTRALKLGLDGITLDCPQEFIRPLQN
jgi:glycerophosphoryl diester phosphodiesterase